MKKWDELPYKSLTKIKRQKKSGLKCTIDGCDSELTLRKGECQDLLCEEHQKNLIIYDGFGRIDRPWTFHRGPMCEICKRLIADIVRDIDPNLEYNNPSLFSRQCRNMTIADHKIRKADGGKDCKDNIQTLCLNCNSYKTIAHEDWRNHSERS